MSHDTHLGWGDTNYDMQFIVVIFFLQQWFFWHVTADFLKFIVVED